MIAPNLEPTQVACATTANLLVPTLPISIWREILIVDHMSRECPEPRREGGGNERRTGRDTLSGIGFHVTAVITVGGGVTSKDAPLPSWEPVVPDVAAQGWGGAAVDTW